MAKRRSTLSLNVYANQHKWEKATAGSAKTDIIFHCAAFCQGVFNQAKNKPKDYTICISLCGRGEKDLDTIQEHIGKDFE